MNSKAVIHKTIMEAEKISKGAKKKTHKKDFPIIKHKYVIPQKYKIYAEDYLNILISTHCG